MSLKSEGTCLSDDRAENQADVARGSKITYTRDFLLSLSDLDVCKKLPDGFDRSILSEFDDVSQDRHRASGGFLSHGFRRPEYSSSPPTRGDSSNYSRGRGRWDSRSSGRSDKDNDSQPDLDSESGRRYGSQSRRPWQAPEHDGLLGSGSFPRPTGYATGSSLPKFRANERYHLNKSSEPYHPPRPYKAGPQPRRETHDSFNDETFGSSECTSEDRVEEERKRRASFELMRKEQVRAIQEQKLNSDKRKDEFDITTLLDGTPDEKRVISKSSDSDQPVKVPAFSGISEKSLPSQGPTSRPLVPPGFKNSAQCDAAEAKNPQPEDDHLVNATHSSLLYRSKHDQDSKQTGENVVPREQQEEISSNSVSRKNDSHMTSLFTAPVKAVETVELRDLGVQNTTGNPAFIIEKLFSSASLDGNSTVEHHGSRADETWSPRTVQSSKFAQWFLEEDQKSVEGLASGQKNDLFSLIGGGEKVEPNVSVSKATQSFSTNVPIHNPDQLDRSISGESEKLYSRGKQNSMNAILTCEDLEQKMLLEASGSGPNPLPQLHGWSTHENVDLPEARVDDQASHRLLSLLQKGAGQKDMAPSLGSSGNIHNTEAEVHTSANNPRNEDAKTNPELGNTLTLETLFGNAFMKELQSANAPVSVRKGSSGLVGGDVSEAANSSFSITGNGLVSPMQATNTSHENYVSVPNVHEKVMPMGIEEQYIGFHDPRMVADPVQFQINSGSMPGGLGKSAEGPQHEVGNLFTLCDSVNLQSLTSANCSVDVAGKFASLSSSVRDERTNTGARGDNVPLFHGTYGSRGSDLPYNIQVHQSPQLGGQLFHSLPSHSANINPQLNFMPPDAIHHNSPPNQYGVDAFRPPFHQGPSGVTAFNQPSHHPMLQQMQVRGNYPPTHLLRGISPGVPLQPHPINQVAGFMPELSQAQGLPPSHRRANFDGPSVPMPASQVGGSSNNPEALQRLIEMELRSKPRQIHPFASAGHSQPDMGFGYNR